MQTESNDTQKAVELTQNMLAASAPGGVFGKEIQNRETTVITASEVVAAMGVGSMGKINGGGGTSAGRPVAIISVNPTGQVGVTPVVDPTKIALAFITVLGSFLVMLGRMRQAGKE